MSEEQTETISVLMPEDLILKLALLAHERDMKLNDLIVKIAVARATELGGQEKWTHCRWCFVVDMPLSLDGFCRSKCMVAYHTEP